MKKSGSSESHAHLELLRQRFIANPGRHRKISWEQVTNKLSNNSGAMERLRHMEETGGEPDVIELPDGNFVFMDCSAESPAGRRSLAFDKKGRESRKDALAKSSALEMADKMGVQLLNEAQYRYLQTLGEFDTKTSVWLDTPEEMRSLGGALFGDRRFNRVFVYHNGAQSFYAARGFRGILTL